MGILVLQSRVDPTQSRPKECENDKGTNDVAKALEFTSLTTLAPVVVTPISMLAT